MTTTANLRSTLAELLQLERPLIVLDYETTSADTSIARICSIGMRKHNPDGTMQPYKTLVNPDILMPRDAERTHGITDTIIKEGCAFCWKVKDDHPNAKCEAWKPIRRFRDLAPRLLPAMTDVDFSGYNIDYDLAVAAEEFNRQGMVFDYSGARIIDSLRIEQILEPRTLSAVYERRTGKPLKGAHDAMVDVEATEELLIAQMEFTILPRTVDQLHDLLWPPDPNKLDRGGKFIYSESGILVFGFGKHKNKPVKNELSYIRWMLGASFPPDIRRLCNGILDGSVPLVRGDAQTPSADSQNPAAPAPSTFDFDR